MKQKKRLYLLVPLALVSLLLLLTGTYAAYTNTAFIKRVVTTGIDANTVPFSSNYLYEYSSGTYYRHAVTVPKDGSTPLYLAIYNYPLNNSTEFSSSDITYTLSVAVVDKDGNGTNLERPSITPEPSTHTLKGGQISTDVFTITFTSEEVTAYQDHLIRITATSTTGLEQSVTLAAEFELIYASTGDASWKGQFTDKELPSQLDAFNYEVSGTAKGTVTISWDGTEVALSNWCREDLAPGTTGNSISFAVGGENQPTSYLLQFYRLKGRADNDSFPNIQLTFTPAASESPEASEAPAS